MTSSARINGGLLESPGPRISSPLCFFVKWLTGFSSASGLTVLACGV
jgi:hypothetical protein